MPHHCHKSLAVTGAICIATATTIPGSIAARSVKTPTEQHSLQQIDVEHPCGKITVSLFNEGDKPETVQAAVVRSARKLLSGEVFVPEYQNRI
ncbi:4-oxalomesaconate tautomerase [compost metagenome]